MAQRSVVSTEVQRDSNGMPTALVVTVDGHTPIRVTLSEIAVPIMQEAIVHGLRQKLIDAAALERDERGRPASAEDKYAAIRAVFDRITDPEDPQWNGRAEGDGTSGAGYLVRAVMEACGLDIDAAKRAVAAWDRKTQAAMRADPTLAPIIRRLKDEAEQRKGAAAARSIDTSALLAGLRE